MLQKHRQTLDNPPKKKKTSSNDSFPNNKTRVNNLLHHLTLYNYDVITDIVMAEIRWGDRYYFFIRRSLVIVERVSVALPQSWRTCGRRIQQKLMRRSRDVLI